METINQSVKQNIEWELKRFKMLTSCCSSFVSWTGFFPIITYVRHYGAGYAFSLLFTSVFLFILYSLFGIDIDCDSEIEICI